MSDTMQRIVEQRRQFNDGCAELSSAGDSLREIASALTFVGMNKLASDLRYYASRIDAVRLIMIDHDAARIPK